MITYPEITSHNRGHALSAEIVSKNVHRVQSWIWEFVRHSVCVIHSVDELARHPGWKG
jgi:hypothetical protein